MRVLGLDVGSKTIGLALGRADVRIATAWDVLQRRGQAEDASAIAGRVSEEGVGRIVVGLPLELDGREARRARAVRTFMAALAAALPPTVGVEAWDERFSTAAAERTLIAADLSRAQRKLKIDAMAAQFILQGWLDSPRNECGGDL